MKKHLGLLIAEFFYLGRLPYAPGTWGTLGSLSIWVPAVYFSWSVYLKLSIIILLFFIGLWACRYGINHYQKSDPSQVVIDEVVGQGFPFLIIGPSFIEIFLAFIFFRLFDIWKPWPIKNIETAFKNELGIMADDVIAGIYAMAVLFIFINFFR